MKNSTKILLLSLCAVLLVATSIFGTLAYLTDTENVQNTFTVGQVGLDLNETQVDPVTGNKVGTTQVKTNTYHLLPGHKYSKDPTVTVDAGSEECYVRMIVTVTFQNDITSLNIEDLEGIIVGYNADWNRDDYKLNNVDGKTVITYEYRYIGEEYQGTTEGTVEKSKTATTLPALFTDIVVPSKFDNKEIKLLDGMQINIVAHAIQADGFDNADEAWAAFAGQNS